MSHDEHLHGVDGPADEPGTSARPSVGGRVVVDEDARAQLEAEQARREAEVRRRDRERADRLVAREQERGRRDAEKADQASAKDAERARRDADKRARDLVTQQQRIESEARKEAERQRRERERAARDAAKEAGRAQREAENAERAAALARQRAEREAEKARREALRAEQAGRSDDEEAIGPAPVVVGLPRDVAVLWQPQAPARRGPRPGLSLGQIADAGIALADAEGLDAVSMSRLAESLGFTTMSLYRYVSSKDEVLMLMSDRASGRPPQVGPEVGDWRARLETLLVVMQPMLRAHPWLARTTSTLFAVGPNRLSWMEAMLATLDGTPLPEQEKLAAIGLLSSHQLEWVRLTEADEARRSAAAASRDGAGERGPDAIIEALADPARHPALARAVASGAFAGPPPGVAYDADELDFGTRLILDGLSDLIRRRG